MISPQDVSAAPLDLRWAHSDFQLFCNNSLSTLLCGDIAQGAPALVWFPICAQIAMSSFPQTGLAGKGKQVMPCKID